MSSEFIDSMFFLASPNSSLFIESISFSRVISCLWSWFLVHEASYSSIFFEICSFREVISASLLVTSSYNPLHFSFNPWISLQHFSFSLLTSFRLLLREVSSVTVFFTSCSCSLLLWVDIFNWMLRVSFSSLCFSMLYLSSATVSSFSFVSSLHWHSKSWTCFLRAWILL